MTKNRLAPWLAALSALSLLACGGSSEPDPNAVDALPSPPFSRLPASPSGTTLPGAPEDAALAATRWMPPSPAAASDISPDGLILDRLAVAVAPGATVAEVNAALADEGATILSMAGGSPVLVVRIPGVADEAEIRAAADGFAAREPFVHAGPVRTAAPVAVSSALPSQADAAWHWDAMNLWAAWNVLDGAPGGPTLRVFSVDLFGSDSVVPGMGFETTIADGAGFPRPGENGGHHALGLIGGAFEGLAPGVAPEGWSLPVGIHASGLSDVELIYEIASQLGDVALDRYVLRTDVLYRDDSAPFDLVPRGERAVAALVWRIVRATTPGLRDPQIVQVTPGGDDRFGTGEAILSNSLFALAARVGDLRAFAAQGGPGEAAGVEVLWNTYAAANPDVSSPTADVLLVGAHDLLGDPLPGGAAGADLSAPGFEVPGLCISGCDADGLVELSGSAVASSLIAGLATAVWCLDDGLSAAAVIERVRQAVTSEGYPDAYGALLSVDAGLAPSQAPARHRLLDVSGPVLGVLDPNGRFDEVDLETFLELFESFEVLRQSSGVAPDHSRFDLNGNAFTGGAADETDFDPFAAFDLDAQGGATNGALAVTIADREVVFDEGVVTDGDVLCFYAYSALYEGDGAMRDELFADVCRSLEIAILGPGSLSIGQTGTYTVRVDADTGSGFEPAPDVDVEVSVVGGSASPSSGRTDVAGELDTDITASLAGPLEIEVRATSSDGRSGVARRTVSVGDPAVEFGGDVDADWSGFDKSVFPNIVFPSEDVSADADGSGVATAVNANQRLGVTWSMSASVSGGSGIVSLDVEASPDAEQLEMDFDLRADIEFDLQDLVPGSVLVPQVTLSEVTPFSAPGDVPATEWSMQLSTSTGHAEQDDSSGGTWFDTGGDLIGYNGGARSYPLSPIAVDSSGRATVGESIDLELYIDLRGAPNDPAQRRFRGSYGIQVSY